MISNLRISVAELVVWALLAVAGLTWITLRALDGAAWLMGWLRDRVTPLLEADEDRIDPDDPYDACPECGSWTQCEHDRKRLGLPPERTWEQMTSHQLPVVGMSARERKDWEHREGVRRRGARRVEMTHRAHYAAMGMDYPSGLMARVRELTP